MTLQLIQRRTIWWPTRLGWFWIILLTGGPLAFWCARGEDFLSLTEPLPAEALVVEGWIGVEGVRAAKVEFDQGHYRYIITSGGPMNGHWRQQGWNYATEASEILVRLGIPAAQVITAAAPGSQNHRTFESASVVQETLEKRGLHFTGINVFTAGAHARRSRLVFAKAMYPSIGVGVISWLPPAERRGVWWNSSERSLDLIKETIGYFFELFLNSGRLSNHPVNHVARNNTGNAP